MRYHFDGIDAIVDENDELVYDGIRDERAARLIVQYKNDAEWLGEKLRAEIEKSEQLIKALETIRDYVINPTSPTVNAATMTNVELLYGILGQAEAALDSVGHGIQAVDEAQGG